MKILLTTMLVALSIKVNAQPISPIEGYQTTDHTQSELKAFWRKVKNLDGQFKGKDCFKRANIWSYVLNKYDGVKTKKVFMHYTNKFNTEIDDMGRSGAGAVFGRIFSRNKGWDFHVAPAVTVDGVDYVLDPHLRKQAETTEQWIEFLTERGEYRLKIRHKDLLKDLRKARRKLKSAIEKKSANYIEIAEARDKVKEIEEKLRYLGLTEDPNQRIDIKCKKITHIMEFDANQYNEWCYYQETSMYYFGPLQLRLLNYGNLGFDLRLPVSDSQYHTQQYFNAGMEYTYENFDIDQLEESLNEFVPSQRPDSIYDL